MAETLAHGCPVWHARKRISIASSVMSSTITLYVAEQRYGLVDRQHGRLRVAGGMPLADKKKSDRAVEIG
jgi:hypothetical protein